MDDRPPAIPTSPPGPTSPGRHALTDPAMPAADAGAAIDALPSEPMQRVRIGLTGLAVVFLLVLIGTAILRSGASPIGDGTLGSAAAPPNDPMAEIGAAPASSEDATPQNRAVDDRAE